MDRMINGRHKTLSIMIGFQRHVAFALRLHNPVTSLKPPHLSDPDLGDMGMPHHSFEFITSPEDAVFRMRYIKRVSRPAFSIRSMVH
jgi:hypothetical protein